MTTNDPDNAFEEELTNVPPRKREIIDILRDPAGYIEDKESTSDFSAAAAGIEPSEELQASEIATLMGDITESTVRDYIYHLRQDYGFVIESKNGTKRGYTLEDDFVQEYPQIVEALHEDGLSMADFDEQFGLTSKQVYNVLDDLRELGHRLDHHIIDGTAEEKLYYIPEDRGRTWEAQPDLVDESGDKKTFRFGLISDTHLGSTACHLKDLHDFYDRLEERGISTVYHAGDMTDGWKVYEGHINEVVGDATGWGRLKDYTVENYPQRDGIDTLVIEGNHDRKYYRRAQMRLLKLVDNERPDIHYVGDCQANFILDEHVYTDAQGNEHTDTVDLELIHPSGGKPYSEGYRAQTVYRERPLAGRPTISGMGHLHGKAWFFTHGVEVFYPACWKGVTTYGKRKGHNVKIGGWIVEVTTENGKLDEIDPSFIRYEAKDTTQQFTSTDVAELTSD